MAAPKAQAAVPPPLPPPPVAPVSGITPARKAIAPTLTEEPKGQNPKSEYLDRFKGAMDRAMANAGKVQDDAAGEDAAPPPKAAPKPTPSVEPGKSSDSKKPAADSTVGKPESGKADAKAVESKSASSEPAPVDAERRYDVQSLRKWAEKNPEEAALVREKVFGLPADTNQEWIRLKNRERKLKEGLNAEREKTVSDAQAERKAAEEARQAIDGAATKLAPIADLWEAVAEKMAANPENPQIDFEAADAAFQENARMSIDDYMRLRARRAIGSGPDAVKLRAENARLKRELAGKPSDAVKPKAAVGDSEATPAAAADAPKGKPARDWSGELAEGHKLRQFEGWNKLLDDEMRKHYDRDLDEYGADPDDIASKILKREIEAMATELEPQVAAKPKPKPSGAAKPNGQPKTKAAAPTLTPAQLTPSMSDPDEDAAVVGGMTWAQRQKRAIDRAMARGRGEID